MLVAVLLALASQRLEYLVMEWFGPDWMQEILEDWKRRERGSLPGIVEFAVIIYVFSEYRVRAPSPAQHCKKCNVYLIKFGYIDS